MWRCECLKCGTIVLVPTSKLKEGAAKSCGCQQGNPGARTAPGQSGFNALYNNYLQGAKRRQLCFELTKEQFKKLTKLNCTYCGKKPTASCYGSRGNVAEHGKYMYNGIDRLDSALGYTINNCVTACAECNLAKGTRSYKEFYDWITRIYNNFVNT
jgi:5-methylcytosine-specific restriction endonuclease McrA